MVSRPVKPESPHTIVIAGGGTGGHLYPGLAVAEALGARLYNPRVVFVGTNRAIDRHVLERINSDWVIQALPRLSPLPWRWPTMIRRYRQSASIVARFFDAHPPAAVIGTGGFGSVPAVRQAWRRGIPTFLLNPDALAGRANRFLARNVKIVFASWPGLEKHLPSKTSVRVHGCPVRADFLPLDAAQAGRSAALGRFGLDPDLKTLLVTGASQGARSINDGIAACLPALVAIDGWQLLHLTGHQDHDRIRQAYAGVAFRGVVLSYTDHMADAITAADLVVSRAGASTLAEITVVGRASVLMPYPYHRNMHQLANARCLERESAATIVPDGIDSSVNAPRLTEALTALMKNDQLREAMAVAAGRIGRPSAAEKIAEDIMNIAFARGPGGAIPETLEVSPEQARYV